ncbi:MAG: substrate-binding domain-containing protein, partial [Phycisphaerae bacterium]
AMVYAAPEVATARTLMDVYKEKLARAGLVYEPTRCQDGRFTEQGGAAATEEILKLHPDTTALFAGNDKMALGALHHLNRLGVKVPGEVSLVGFDDLQQSGFVTPALTTVHLPLYEVGVQACERLIERIRGKVERVAEILPAHLILRESTALAAR